MTIRTACSASLIALDKACQDVTSGRCTSAIVGGANLLMSPTMIAAMSEQGVLAPDGSCKTFSADADGYARGEGICALYIKSLSDAVRDGNPIRAVIRATATNANGRTAGIAKPSSEGQEAMIRRAYALAKIPQGEIGTTAFVECHGTGTRTGDPIETKALARIFGPSGGVYIGSVKPNLGHSEGASGLTSVIKAVLALENQTIPPNIKFTKPNPHITFREAGLVVPVTPTPWPVGRAERVSVSSFGIGGSNAHVILDSATSFGVPSQSKSLNSISSGPNEPHLIMHSANNSQSLKQTIADHADYLKKHPGKESDLAYTLANRREHLPYRSFSIVRHADGIDAGMPSEGILASDKPPRTVMVFTGQGAQWPMMGMELLSSKAYPAFRNSIRGIDTHLQSLSDPPSWRIEKQLTLPGKAARIDSAELAQPLCTAVQIALVDTYRALGIRPFAVVGHSSGEMAAAYAAGALTAREAIVLAFERGRVVRRTRTPGGMAAISLSRTEAEQYLEDGVCIGCDNAPSSVTLSGDAEKLVDVLSRIARDRPDALIKVLHVDAAYHSHHMADIAGEYRALVEDEVDGAEPTHALFFSSVTGRLFKPGARLDPDYWEANLTSPVLFNQAVSSLLQHSIAGNNTILLEVGPHKSLTAPLRQIQAAHSTGFPYVPSLIRHTHSTVSLLTAIGRLYQHGVRIDFSSLLRQAEHRTLPDLPRYPWDHSTSYWFESRLSREWRQRVYPHHDLLGVRQPESTEMHPSWRNLLHLDGNASWIRDHKIKGDVVFPFAGYAAMAGEAVMQLAGDRTAERSQAVAATSRGGYDLRNMVMSTVLVLHEGEGTRPVEMITSFKRGRLTDSIETEWWEFSIESHNGTSWTRHCVGEARAVQLSRHQIKALKPRAEDPIFDSHTPREVEKRRCYQRLRQCGWNYGPRFQVLADIRTGTRERIATAKSTWTPSHESFRDDREFYAVHPTIVDGAVQIIGTASTLGWTRWLGLALPTSVKLIEVREGTTHEDSLQVAVNATEVWSGHLTGTSVCRSGTGQTVLRLTGVTMTIVEDEKPPDGLTVQGLPITARCVWTPHPELNGHREAAKLNGERLLSQRARASSSAQTDRGAANQLLHQSTGGRRILTVLHDVQGSNITSHPVVAQLTDRGFGCTPVAFGQRLPSGQDIIALLDRPSESFFSRKELSQQRFETFKDTLSHVQRHGRGIFWITGSCQYRCTDPRFAQIIGAARTARSEMMVDFATCEVDDLAFAEGLGAEKLVDCVQHFLTRHSRHDSSDQRPVEVAPSLNPEMEYVIQNNTVYMGRYEPVDLEEEMRIADPNDRAILQTDKPGRLDALSWARHPAAVSLKTNEVEVEVHATGLNFKDVLGAMAITPLPKNGLGLEAAGRVRRVGPGVRDLQPGDRTMCLSSGQGTFASEVVTKRQLCVRIPDNLTFEEAATMPCVYATALYALVDIGRLEEGQSVLIQSACGGVGLAAVQIAQMVGATMFATVGSQDKVEYLAETFSIPRANVFNSRSVNFADDLMRATGAKGVDVVLNSLAGELLHASWSCVAPFGRMVEIGKRDLLGHGRLDMDMFEQNRSYCAVDLEGLCRDRPAVVQR
jgi:acyl transferase domain-containing protein/NADPH:quinone reductase-like Zn-dependent oxidoreductase